MKIRAFARISPILFAALICYLMFAPCRGATLWELEESSSVHELSKMLTGSSVSPLVSIGHRRLETNKMALLEVCKPLEKCEMCTFTDQKSIPSCKETGRKQKMECTAFDGDGKRRRSQLRIAYEKVVSPSSLSRQQDDHGLLQLQIHGRGQSICHG